MAYKSLYRKYRPSKFDDVYGQQFIIKTLKNAIENDKISHAYLFSGMRGTGKTTIAKIFAKMVNCIEMKNNIPCGKCEICINENTDEIPDIIEIDAASNNGVDEIRELKNKIKLVPVMCKYKVYIIDEVHMLSTGAFNALLKTLEEPPSHVIFILATTEPQKLPITIISRCQRFDFKKISENEIFNRLKYISIQENIRVEDDALLEIAKMSDGAMRDAIGTLDQISSYSENEITIDDIYILKGSISTDMLVDFIKCYINRDLINMLDKIEKFYFEGKNFLFIAEDMLMFFRNALILKKASMYFKNKTITLKEKIEELSNDIDIYTLENIIIKLEELIKNIKESNYPRILFEVFLLSDISITKSKKINVYSEKTESKCLPILNEKESENKFKETNEIKLVMNTDTKETNIEIFSQTNDKKVLINNTIALATNKHKKNVQEKFENIDKYLITKKYKNAATILKDANIVAASDNHLLLTYKYLSMVEDNDNNLKVIKELISNLLSKDYKIVAITEEEWKQQRPYYLELKKKNGSIEILEEIIENINQKNNVENSTINNDLIDIFGSELIEMEG